ncbi:MAG: DegT/DnrJ/EryC1/StrS family aminotransferase [Candidatus Nitrosotenuis sp.]
MKNILNHRKMLKPEMNKIKLFDPYIDKSERIIVNRIFDSGFWASGAGVGYVQKFEKEFSKYILTKDCVAVNSGTAALNLALSMYEIKNKEVILPSVSSS